MIFLARSGRVFGPFSEAEVTAMREKGDLDRYSWLWNAETSGWQAIDPPPPPLVAPLAAPKVGPEYPIHATDVPPRREAPRQPPASLDFQQPAPPRASFAPRGCTKRIEAICHDSHQLVSGILAAITESGCSLVSRADDGGPVFAQSTPLLLSLLDPATGNSMNVRARLAAASREGGEWHYRLQWDQYPDILFNEA